MTILEALTWGEEQLKSTAFQKRTTGHNAKFDAQILLASVLTKSTSYLFAHFDQPLNEQQLDAFQRLIKRRANHEPVAYLLKEKAFYGRTFIVTPDVLIPRPDTETLIDAALHSHNPSLIIDIGTGSGAIAVTLAAELGQPVIAIDTEKKALDIARQNATRHHVDHMISFLEGDLLVPYLKKQITESGHTLIAANLPYLPVHYSQTMDPDVAVYEPNQALYAGMTGLDLYEALLRQLKEHRNQFSTVELLMEIDPSQSRSLPQVIRTLFPAAEISVHQDLSGNPRVVRTQI